MTYHMGTVRFTNCDFVGGKAHLWISNREIDRIRNGLGIDKAAVGLGIDKAAVVPARHSRTLSKQEQDKLFWSTLLESLSD